MISLENEFKLNLQKFSENEDSDQEEETKIMNEKIINDDCDDINALLDRAFNDNEIFTLSG